MKDRETTRRKNLKEVAARAKEGDVRTEALDAATVAAIDKGIRSEKEDRIYTWEEVKQIIRERRRQWTSGPNDPLA